MSFSQRSILGGFQSKAWLTRLNSNCGTSKTPLWRRSPAGSTICNACGLYLKARNTARPMNLKKPTSTSVSEPSSEYDATDNAQHNSPLLTNGALPSAGASGAKARHISTGSCPGGGRCDGTGGADGCNGCPAYNNRLSKKPPSSTSRNTNNRGNTENADENTDPATQLSQEEQNIINDQSQPSALSNAGTGELSCKNCATTITPLWRRDEGGHTICNACGMFL